LEKPEGDLTDDAGGGRRHANREHVGQHDLMREAIRADEGGNQS
jgi:hypothetical protein